MVSAAEGSAVGRGRGEDVVAVVVVVPVRRGVLTLALGVRLGALVVAVVTVAGVPVAPGGSESGDLQRRLLAAPFRTPALADEARRGVDRPARLEAAAERQRDVGLTDREGGGAQPDDEHVRHQHAGNDADEAAEGEQPPAQPRLVLQQHLAEQPQRDDAERDVEDRPAHVRPSPSGRYAVCRKYVRPV
ncbi:hypothetical protein RKD48_005820 [Streptomyces ambofaciens]